MICGHQALNLYAWTLNMYICWWAGQRMLDTWVCTGKCCNAVFFPNVIRNLGGMRGHKQSQAFILLFSSRWAVLYRAGQFPFWKWSQPFIAHYPSPIHLIDMCMWERGNVCVCVCVCVCVYQCKHLCFWNPAPVLGFPLLVLPNVYTYLQVYAHLKMERKPNWAVFP